jgi:hypothetical protein
MKSLLSKRVVIGVTALAVLGGAGGALAATQASNGSHSSAAQAYVNGLAKHLDITPSALTAAVKATDSEQIETALAAGRLTQTQANAAKQRIEQSTSVPLFDRAFGGRGLRGLAGKSDPAAAQYLGISEAALRSQLKTGQSLEAIATSTPGKSVAGLKAAIIAAQTTRLNTAVSSGKITAQQEQRRLTSLSSRIDTLLQHTRSAGANGGQAHSSSRY